MKDLRLYSVNFQILILKKKNLLFFNSTDVTKEGDINLDIIWKKLWHLNIPPKARIFLSGKFCILKLTCSLEEWMWMSYACFVGKRRP